MDWISTNILSLLNLLILVTLSLFGRNWVNRKSEEIKSLYSKKEIIYRMRIQREFEIYQLLWRRLVDLRESALNVDSLLTIYGLDFFKKEEMKKESLRKFYGRLKEAMNIINSNIPFYDKKIFKLSQEITETSKWFGELISLSEIKSEKHAKLAESIEEINLFVDKVEKAIRKNFGLHE